MSMIDISAKPDVSREAIASGEIQLKPETLRLIQENRVTKGDVLSLAKVAGIMAAKKTSAIIPLCHPLSLSAINVKTEVLESQVTVEAHVKAFGKTGVEMEALTAVSAALLTIWDMTKQYEKDPAGQYPCTIIQKVRVLHKVKTC